MPVSSTYLLRRLLYMIISIIGVSVFGFILFRIVPGDPVLMMVSPTASLEDIETLRHQLGFDRPLYIQYINWFRDFLAGSFGTSIRYNTDVLELVTSRLPATLEPVIVSILVAFVIGVLIGVISAVKSGSWADRILTGFSFLGFSLPHFLWGIVFIVIFGAIAHLLPVSGRIDIDFEITPITGFILIDTLVSGNLAAFKSALAHIALPAISLALSLIAILHRTLKSSMLDVLGEDYIFTDRMKGLPERKIIFERALRNALIPTITILGVQFTFLMGGSIIIEYIFGWPGMGTLLFTAVQYKDLPLLQGIVMVYALIVVLTNFLVDLTYTIINPKIELR